jgi:hypothetical protein
VIFARSEDHAPLRRPLLLLLVEGYALGPGVLRAAAAALQAGFRPVVTPWFALALSECGIAAVAGFELLADEARRAIAGTEQLRPDAVAVLADVRRLGRAARVAVDGLVNASGAAVIAPLLDGAAMAAADCHGVLSFAPIRFWTAHSAADDEPEALCGALADGDARTALLAAGDPARVLLPLSLTAGQARFGFIATDGTGVDLPLLRAWLAAAAPRCAPRLPFLLPTPRFLRADAGEAPLYRTAAPMRLDPARPPGPPALAQMLPSPAAGHVFVPTAARQDAAFDFLHPGLEGPSFTDTNLAVRSDGLLRHTARSIDEAACDDRLGLRLVEPGVGRAVVVDHLALAGRPDLMDFTALGVGLTPYSRDGFVDVGRAIDGLAALCRGRHRRTCAERLEAAGCRAGAVAAIATLADDTIDVPGVGRIRAAIVVRGFRCVLRVKQLDPIGCFYHSIQHAPLAHDFLTHPLWDRLAGGSARQNLLMALESYAAASSLAGLMAPPADMNAARARARRLETVRLYAPMVLEMVRARLAVELGRDPETQAPDNAEYVQWFAGSLGRQFAQFRRLRFLHDYHQPGIGRASPAWLYTLGENNVTLLAEFPDLDTGVFVDRYDAEHMDEVFLSRSDFTALADGFAQSHARDVEAGRTVLRTLGFVALDGDAAALREADRTFDRAYAEALDRAA